MKTTIYSVERNWPKMGWRENEFSADSLAQARAIVRISVFNGWKKKQHRIIKCVRSIVK